MGSLRAKRVILCSLILAILISTVAVLSCYAEDYPDISTISPNLYLSDHQQFFHRTGGGFALISTDSTIKTLAALLNSDGEIDTTCVKKPISISFAYEKTAQCGNFLYIAGKSPEIDRCVEIERIDLSTGKYIVKMIMNVECDFSRDFSAATDAKLSLVTAPIGGVIEPNTRASLYFFDTENNDPYMIPLPADPVSSELSGNSSTVSSNTGSTTSDAASSLSSSNGSSSPSSTVVSQQPDDSEPALSVYRFDGPVTVESLQKELDTNALGQKLHVFSGNVEVKNGCIGTGQIIKTFLNSKLESQYIAMIPGDLNGTGTVTADDCQILYTYFTGTSASGSAILNGTFLDAAKINDNKKIDAARKEVLPSDLLKIKKLIK